MKKTYIRAGVAPFEAVGIAEVLRKNLIGQNSGNLIYQYSLFRTLTRAHTEFDARYENEVCRDPYGVDRLNETCSMAILPLANAFRTSFNLKALTQMVRGLKIPCVVIGCGLQAARPEDIAHGFPFDDDVRSFVSAVLDKSAMLGLRGEYTAEYLKRLGFSPERHFTVIGCPSLYLNGASLPMPQPRALNRRSRLNINTLTVQNPALDRLIFDAERHYPDYHVVVQEQRELAMLAFGTINSFGTPGGDKTGFYPLSPLHQDVREGRIIGFTEARTWLDFLRDVDYSFGSRLHGNLAAVVSGTPAFVFTSDVRTEEICRYGNIAHMPLNALKDGTSIESVLEKADFTSVAQGYGERFDHFLDFLDANGVEHIYREGREPAEVPFDTAMARLPMGGYVRRGCLPTGEALLGQVAFYGAKLRKKTHRLFAARLSHRV